MSETRIVADILLMIGREFPQSVRAWRNNSGMLYDRHGRPVRFGLVGSADIIGLIGGSGRFLAIEVKVPGRRRTTVQESFSSMVTSLGGVSILATSVDEARAGILSALQSI